MFCGRGSDSGTGSISGITEWCVISARNEENSFVKPWNGRSRGAPLLMRIISHKYIIHSTPYSSIALKLTLFRLSACFGGVTVGKRFGLELALFVCRIRFRLNSYSTPSATVVVAVGTGDPVVPLPPGSNRVEPANDCLHESPNLLDTIWSSV
uniref:Uncharacterized protein n=1 Tax=Anopheles culicifacies TaxID=139723 RepID=A0A182LU85_9DIPT